MVRFVLAMAASLMLATPAYAVESAVLKDAVLSLPKCNNVMRFDDQNVYAGFGPYMEGVTWPRKKIPSYFEVRSIVQADVSAQFETLDGVVSFATVGESLYVLTYTGIEEWDLARGERVAVYPTYHLGREMVYREHPTGMVQFEGKLFISHGRLGLSIFDTKTKRLADQQRLLKAQLPLESQATDIAVSGSTALIAVDSFSMVKEGVLPFHGVIVYDLKSQKVVKELTGLDQGATSISINGSNVVVGYFARLWKFDLKSILNAKNKVAPVAAAREFPLPGYPVGKPALDAENIYTCFLREPETRPGRYKFMPQVWNYSEIGF